MGRCTTGKAFSNAAFDATLNSVRCSPGNDSPENVSARSPTNPPWRDHLPACVGSGLGDSVA
jgi:hypothetical protein